MVSGVRRGWRGGVSYDKYDEWLTSQRGLKCCKAVGACGEVGNYQLRTRSRVLKEPLSSIEAVVLQ